jgi:sugar phosphate isomerase/epimerase
MKIALNTYSLRKEWGLLSDKNYAPFLKFLKMLNVGQVELISEHFEYSSHKLGEIKQVLSDNGFSVFAICPSPHILTNTKNWEKARQEGKNCVDIAADNGIKYCRMLIGGGYYDPPEEAARNISEAVEWSFSVLKPVVEYAESRNVELCIETSYRYSSHPEFQEKLLTRIASPNLGFVWNIGNFETDQFRWQSLKTLIRNKAVKYVHAKAYAFDDQGMETKLDYLRAAQELHEGGLDPFISIEWEGALGGPLGALKTNELCKYAIVTTMKEQCSIRLDFPDETKIMEYLTNV